MATRREEGGKFEPFSLKQVIDAAFSLFAGERSYKK